MNFELCPSCDARSATTRQGLCGPCQNSLVLITRPAAHRELWRRKVSSRQPDVHAWQDRGVVVIASVPTGNDRWICDWCNDPIAIHAEHTLIPLIGSYALCPPCVTKIDYWPDAWTQPAPRACPCDACQQPLQRQAHRDRVTRNLHPPRGMGR